MFESRVKTTAATFSHPEGQPEHAPPPPRPFGLVAALIRSTPSVSRGVSKPRTGSLRTRAVNDMAAVLARLKTSTGPLWPMTAPHRPTLAVPSRRAFRIFRAVFRAARFFSTRVVERDLSCASHRASANASTCSSGIGKDSISFISGRG